MCGGEALPTALVDELLSRGAELWHMYGPTETTVWSAIHRLRLAEGAPAIGGPIANTTFHVLDDRLQPVAVGIPGQLFIGGDGLARGYHNRTELRPRSSFRTRSGPGAFTRPGTSSAVARAAHSSSWAVSIPRSSFAGFGSNWARSRQYSKSTTR